MKLDDKIEKYFRLNDIQKKALKRLSLESISDLIFYLPIRYTDVSQIKNINTLENGENVTILGKISKLKTKKSFKSKIPIGEAILTDITGNIKIIWFHQPYLAKIIKDGDTVRVSGKVSESETYGLVLTNPEISKESILPVDIHDSLFKKDDVENIGWGFPIYRETRGITSKWIYHSIIKILKDEEIKKISEYLPSNILEQYKLPKIYTALVWIHMPQKRDHAESARKRFAFEEIFFIQLARKIERRGYDEMFSYKLNILKNDVDDFISRFPFSPTNAQKNTLKSIIEDFKKEKPMSRLVEGDVGSGKTFIASVASYAVIKNRPAGQDFGNLQVAYMAPTEVLATQLYENFISYFAHTGISIGLITGSGCRKFPSKVASQITRTEAGDVPEGICATSSSNLRSQARMRIPEGISPAEVYSWTTISRNQLLKWVKNGEISILVGTHALISKSVDFKDLGLVIIDEQHRFGTNQRAKLAKKDGHAPHYLSMSATPIPRTLALTIYGDLDISVIDEMPKGRKPVITEIVSEDKRENAYKKINEDLARGKQVYVICPRINEPDSDQENALQMKNVTTEAKRLQKEIFPKYKVGIMHSKMNKNKKEEVMQDFKNKKIDILVSTSVIEVGVNVPNATSIVIEGAERFGLAQLHQLRGRVARSSDQAYCYLFADAKTEKTIERLKAMTKAKNGFELAELDLSLRGAGDLYGVKQWGITDLGMEAIKNIKLVEIARDEAQKLADKDCTLSNYPNLKSKIQKYDTKNLHFE